MPDVDEKDQIRGLLIVANLMFFGPFLLPVVHWF